MEGVIHESVQIVGSLSVAETLTGTLTDKRESHPIVDGEGNHLIDSNDNTLVDYSTAEPLIGYLSDVSTLSGNISATDEIHANLSTVDEIVASISIPESTGGLPYTGDYEVTPSDEIQVLATQGKSMSQNVTINPIPSNYGRITWNGSFLTVS